MGRILARHPVEVHIVSSSPQTRTCKPGHFEPLLSQDSSSLTVLHCESICTISRDLIGGWSEPDVSRMLSSSCPALVETAHYPCSNRIRLYSEWSCPVIISNLLPRCTALQMGGRE